MNGIRARAISRQPSPYPSFLFHSIRLAQAVSSIIVTSILGYFIYHLRLSYYEVPWTFILLISVADFSIAFILISTFFYHRRNISPKTSAYCNGFLTVLWMLGVALIGWNLSGTLGTRCTIEGWGSEAGVMVCRIYKALTAFTVIGLFSTAAGLLLDVRTLRVAVHKGNYNPMAEYKPRSQHPSSSHNLLTKELVASPGLDTATYREPSLEFPEYSHEVKKPYRVQRPMEAKGFSYTAPSEQTQYDGAGSPAMGGYGNGGV